MTDSMEQWSERLIVALFVQISSSARKHQPAHGLFTHKLGGMRNNHRVLIEFDYLQDRASTTSATPL